MLVLKVVVQASCCLRARYTLLYSGPSSILSLSSQKSLNSSSCLLKLHLIWGTGTQSKHRTDLNSFKFCSAVVCFSPWHYQWATWERRGPEATYEGLQQNTSNTLRERMDTLEQKQGEKYRQWTLLTFFCYDCAIWFTLFKISQKCIFFLSKRATYTDLIIILCTG